MPPFPTDDFTLDQLEHALKGVYTVDPDGTHHLTRADFDVHQLLEFMSGYDPSKRVQVEDGVFEYPDPIYSQHDVIDALIAEVRRLRNKRSELTEYRTVFHEQPIPGPRVYSSSDELPFQRTDLAYLLGEGKNAWIERRTATAWERVDD